MLPECHGPIWAMDDVSCCFQHKYLQVIFPLATCALSLSYIVLRAAYRSVVTRKESTYNALVDEAAENAVTRIEQLRWESDRPRCKLAVVALEVAAIVGLMATFIIILDAKAWGDDGTLPAVSKLISWGYIMLLVLMRFMLSPLEQELLPRLGDQTTVLYGMQWLFNILVFRSAVIYPKSKHVLAFSAVEFSLSTLLLLISLTTRRDTKAVPIRYEDGLEPPRHLNASLLSLATFSWLDPLIWRSCKQPLELDDVWNLTTSQKAVTVFEDFRRRDFKGSLAWRLGRYFHGTILLQGAWAILSSLFTYLPTLLLKAILEYVEDPRSTTANAAWLYAIVLLCSGAIQGIGNGQALWIGRKLDIELRAIIVGEIYAKTLRRKAGSSPGTTKKKKEAQTAATKNNFISFGHKQKKAAPYSEANTKTPVLPNKKAPSQMANVGTIIDLMAVDSFKISEVGAYLHFLWASVPVQIIIAVTFLYRLLGFSSFAGIVVMVVMIPVNMVIAKNLARLQNQILARTDARIHATNEVLHNIRTVKYFAWEQRFQSTIDKERRAELRSLRYRYVLLSLASAVWCGTPILISFTTFFSYTVIERKKLTPSIAFPAMSLFSLLRVPLDQLAAKIAHVQESKVSLDRIETYLNEEETEKYSQLSISTILGATHNIALEHATLTWGTPRKVVQRESVSDNRDAFRLTRIDVSFRTGRLNIIAGPTGSGKTSLLMGLLGEMELLEGRIHLPGRTANREELPVDPQSGLIESVAYCAQEAWLINATVKENIVFALIFDEGRYNAVIKACALERDLCILDAGDQTVVGEKGICLSGGQKQRISLARAIYSRARHLLLDDCLSAVDSHTAKHIFQEALIGPLMSNRTCILVTHNVALTVPLADYVVILDNGKIKTQGHPDAVVSSGVFGEACLKWRSTKKACIPRQSRLPAESGDEDTDGHRSAKVKVNSSSGNQQVDKVASKLAESKAVGGIQWSTICLYLRSMGPWYYWVCATLVFGLQQMGSVSTNIWIRKWATTYQDENSGSDDASNSVVVTNFKFPSFNAGDIPRSSDSYVLQSNVRQIATTDAADVNISYYLGVYALLGISYVLISLSREGVLFWGSLNASSKFHRRVLDAVMHARFSFFDSTSLGQLMNRFTKDIEVVDQEVAAVTIGLIHCFATVIIIVILISVITPGFLVVAISISLIYFALGAVYLGASRDMKRLAAVQRSPLYQQFSETLNGIVTIRAYGDCPRFVIENHRRINAYNRAHIYLWASVRWLAFRVDILGSLVSFFTAIFVLINTGKIDAGSAGLALTYAVTFTENILWLVGLYSEAQQSLNSVERVKDYLDIEQEAKAGIADSRLPSNWPNRGSVEFIDYTTRYRPDLDAVLRNVSFLVQPGEKVGIVGRTGAGKSSLALALLRGLEAEEGHILIDGLEIGSIGLQDLREAVTIVPQDPTIFTGTIRSNLDPFNLFSDEQIFAALHRVHLLGPETFGSTTSSAASTMSMARAHRSSTNDADLNGSPVQDNKNFSRNLESPISESGSNLSQGQRQLLCLARALLKNPKVLLMDEATASIDYDTDSKIQETLQALRTSTIITIAHRLRTIIDYDKVLVLDHGRVIEYDHPWILVNKRNGLLRSMCENSGDLDVLLEVAKKAWENKRLVDDS